jgi:hypothetical protein
MTPAERAVLRAAGRAKAAELPAITSAYAERVAEMLRAPLNVHIRRGGTGPRPQGGCDS